MRPSVVPLSGSTPIKGTGMNGAVDGSNQRQKPVGGLTGGVIGPGAGACVGSSGGGAAHDAAAGRAARKSRQLYKFTRGSARRELDSIDGPAATSQNCAQVPDRREHLVVPIRALRVISPLLVLDDFLVLTEDVFSKPRHEGQHPV